MEAANGYVIGHDRIEHALEYRARRERQYRNALADGRREIAKLYVSELVGAERVLDMLGIEYEE